MAAGDGSRSRRIRLSIDSVLNDVLLVGAAVKSICKLHFRLDEYEGGRLEIAVVEALNNSIEHGYGLVPGHSVEVEVALSEEAVAIGIRDRGVPIPHGKLASEKESLFDPDDPSTFPERGMGIFIIRQVMDSVEYRSDENGNELRLVKRFRRRVRENA